MGSEAEPAKQLLPYLQRADELQKHEPLVAYYCRLYAMEKGLKIPTKERTKTTNSLLVSLINQLEKDKKTVKLNPDDNLHVEGFASNIFAKADKQDRAGKADLNTAKTFYAAYIFFDILHQFGQLQPDIEQKLKYSLWKAADIRKALKEGRKPEPGPPGGEEEESSSPPSTTINTSDLGPSMSFSAEPPSVDDTSPQVDKMNSQPPPSPPSYHSSEYPSADFRHTPPSGPPENSDNPQPYHQQSFSSHHSMPQNYSSQNPQTYHSNDVSPHDYRTEDVPPRIYSTHEAPPPNYPPHNNIQSYSSHESSIPPYTYPNFQSYPSFNDTTIPAAPTHFPSPSHYQGSEASTGLQTAPAPSYTPPAQYTPPSGNGNHSATTPNPAAAYTYDSNYQPSVEKIADAHKAARFAVGALAFDDVPVAVDFLKRSLDLLTNPSAESH